MARFTLERPALPGPLFEELKRRLLESPLLARSTLAGSFQASRGFALTFTREGLAQVDRRLGAVRPFLELALRRRSGARVQPWWRRFGRWPEPNAFYLNVLEVPGQAEIRRHTDGTLRGPAGDGAALPQQVTVLYLHVPADLRGGRLLLYEAERQVGEVTPVENTLLRFRGDLAHAVERVESAGVRASVVLEQYHLSEAALRQIPSLQLQSKAGFAAHLDDPRPPGDFVLD